MINSSSRILYLFSKEPWRKFTFKEIKSISRSRSESYVYDVMKRFVKEGVLQQEKIGNVIQYSASGNQKAVFSLSTAAEHHALEEDHLPSKEIEGLQKIIPIKLYTLIVTGSYANKKQTIKSDLDMVLISSIDPKKVYSELRHYCEMCIPKIHLYVFTAEEFEKMLQSKEANYGKEIVKNNLIIAGAESYFRLILEAMKNGFTC
jgi:hypothetical protein